MKTTSKSRTVHIVYFKCCGCCIQNGEPHSEAIVKKNHHRFPCPQHQQWAQGTEEPIR